MMLKLSLRASLIATFAASLFLVGLAQLATRYFFQLPELFQQEYANDLEAVRQIQHALQLEVSRKELVAADNAWWRDAYDFMLSDKQSAYYSDFLSSEYEHVETMHGVPQVDGYSYLRPDGQVHFSSVFDHRSLESGEELSVPLESVAALLGTGYRSAVGGFLASESRPFIFVLSTITDDASTVAPSGYLAVWRVADAAFFREVTGSDNARFTLFDPVRDGELEAAVRVSEYGVLPRNQESETQWILNDIFGEPLFVVSQQLPPRNFDDGILSAGSMVGLSATMLLLAVFSAVISRRIVEPVEQLTDFLKSVARSENFSLRLPLERSDEIGVVARYFDRLLDIVESQDRELREKNVTLAKLADHDSLTGVYNRRVFERVLSRDWSLATRYQRPLSCIMLDVDYFGAFNNRFGHPAGDEALGRIASSLQSNVNRASDTLCRYGGEEFVVLLIETGEAAADNLAQRLVTAVENLGIPTDQSDVSDFVTASAGVATLVPKPGDSCGELVKSADEALYRAKEAGRNRVSR